MVMVLQMVQIPFFQLLHLLVAVLAALERLVQMYREILVVLVVEDKVQLVEQEIPLQLRQVKEIMEAAAQMLVVAVVLELVVVVQLRVMDRLQASQVAA
jgi:DNA integrity scanning protein DisA with diadenylate cyclase activity